MEVSLKVVMFPWLAHGHISPFIELAKALNQRNFTIFFCSTNVNLTSIRKTLVKEGYANSIELVELRLPVSPDLPLECHTTKNLPSHLLPQLKQSLDKSAPEFSSILEKIKPDFLIYDFMQPWAATAASELNIPSAIFLTSSIAMSSLKLFYYYNPSSIYPFSNIYLHGEPYLTEMVTTIDDDDYDGRDRFVEAVENSSGMVLVKSSTEIEGEYFDFLSSVIKEKVVLVGTLVQRSMNNMVDDDGMKIISWLNEKEEGSTVFVSFGSEYFPSKEEIKEVAYGLDASGVNFIWVVRSPVGEKSRVDEALPKEFFDGIKEKGLIVTGWAPQAKILTHKSIGGFVSHCGWSSVLEGINYNVPIIALPMHLDQPINARIIDEVGVGVQVMRTNMKLDKEKISKVITEVIKENRGEVVKERQREVSEKIRAKDGQLLDDFADEVKKFCKKNKVLADLV